MRKYGKLISVADMAGEGEKILRKLSGVLIRIRILQGLIPVLKTSAVWCLLACLIRGRMGWEMVNGISALALLVMAFREWPTHRLALKRLEELRPDSDFRFTTFHECAENPALRGRAAWETLRDQTRDLLSRPTPYLSLPGFGFAFRMSASAAALTLIWLMVAPDPHVETVRLPSVLRIKLESGRVRAGSDVPVQVFSEGRMSIPRLQVEPLSDAGSPAQEPAAIPLQAHGGFYEAVLPRVSYSLKLTAVADLPSGGVVSSPPVALKVLRPPTLAFESVLVTPPRYTNLKSEDIRAVGGKLTVLPGTEIVLRLASDVPLSAAAGRYDSPRPLPPLETNWREKQIEVKGKILAPGDLTVSAHSADGLSSDPPFVYSIDTAPDRAPSVVWVLPKETAMDAPVEGLIPMRWQVEDDFGLSAFRLIIKTSDGGEKRVDIPFLPDRRQDISYLLEVASYLSFAGSEIEVSAEAADNDHVGGPNMGRSATLRIRAPTVMDMYQRLTEQGSEVSRVLERLSGESTRLLKKMTAAARTMKAEGKMAWQMEQELVSMAEAATQAKKEAERALSELGRRTESASRQNLLSRETLQKLSSIGSMMNQLLREDYARAQQELTRSLQSVRIDEKERAMMTAKFNLEQFVEQVDRTHRMLSRVSELMAKAEAEKAVRDLAQRADQAMDEKNAGQLESLGKNAAALLPKLQELARDPAFSELKKALAGQASDLSKQFEQAARAMKESGGSASPESQAAQEKLKKSLSELQKALQKDSEKSAAAEKQNAAKLLQSLLDGLIFSMGDMQAGHEYFLSARTRRRPEEYSIRLQKAVALEPVLLYVISETVKTAERLILFDPRPIQMLQRAVAAIRSMSEQDEDPTALALKLKLSYRYTSLAALQLLEISQELQKQGSGQQKGSAMQDLADLLSQMISTQSSLNSRTQMSFQLGNFGESLEQLAFQQELIRRSMEAEAGRFSELQEKLGRIDQLLQDMRKAEEELRKIGPSQAVQERQEKILNKLMELQHSLTDKEEKEEKFEAEPFFGKPADTSSLRIERAKIDEKEFLRGLPPEYRDAGRKYLRSILGGYLQ